MRTNITPFVPVSLLLLITILLVVRSNAQVSVIMQHNNLKRTGWMNQEKMLNTTNVKTTSFGKLFTRAVDDQLYAQPLVVSNLTIKNKLHNVVFAATVNNTVYAFDAEVDTAKTPLWKKNLTPAGHRVIKNSDMTGACFFNYKDFSGNMGIVGTPAIDTASKTLYVVARSVTTGSPKKFVQYLHAIDLQTGSEKPGSPVFITATVNGTGDGSNNGKITFNQQKQNQRPGLLLYKGVVYIAWASHCDWGPYHGWVIGYDAKTLQQKYVYNDTPDGINGGIWMSGQAPAVDDNGYIYVSTGNGTVGKNNNPNDITNRGESILKLSTASGNLRVVDFFTPFNYKQLEQGDLDYGIDGVMLIPNTSLSLSGSKQSRLYLVNNTRMGKTSAKDTGAIQIININPGQGNKHVHGSPVYFKNWDNKEYIYAWAEDGLLNQIPFNRTQGKFDTGNSIKAPSPLPMGMPGAMLALSSNGATKGTGVLWASHPLSGNANHAVVPGIIQAFDAGDVTHELWNSNHNKNRDSVGKFAKFVCPTVANGKVYLSTFSKQLIVYGLLPPPLAQADNIENGVGSIQKQTAFNVYPNPASTEVTIVFNNKQQVPQQAMITLVNSIGNTVFQQSVTLSPSQNSFKLPLASSISSGVYLVKINKTNGEVYTQQLVIER